MKLTEVAKTAADKLQAEKDKIQKHLESYGLWPVHVDSDTGEILKNPNYKPHKNFSNINKIEIRDDLTISVDGDVNFTNSTFKKIPFVFFKIHRIEFTGNKNLASLEGLPDEIGWDLICTNCQGLSTLIGGPKKVKYKISFAGCSGLTSLKGIPTLIGGDESGDRPAINLNSCLNITSLKGLQDTVPGNLILNWCKRLESLEGIPSEIDGYLFMDHLNIESFDFLPKKINGELHVSYCNRVKNYLKLFDIKGIEKIVIENKPNLANIINKYLPTRDMLNCQDELIEAGFEEYAEID